MKTISKTNIEEQIIKKSRFIGIVTPITSEEEIPMKLQQVKNQYKNATHYCFAYRIDNKEKCSDDGEPSKTAGLPILNILKNLELTNILCIVIRYFGGIKLGAGGLIRAYSNTAKLVCTHATTSNLITGIYFQLSFAFDQQKIVDSILKDSTIIQKEYTNHITYSCKIEKIQFPAIQQQCNRWKIPIIIQKQDYL